MVPLHCLELRVLPCLDLFGQLQASHSTAPDYDRHRDDPQTGQAGDHEDRYREPRPSGQAGIGEEEPEEHAEERTGHQCEGRHEHHREDDLDRLGEAKLHQQRSVSPPAGATGEVNIGSSAPTTPNALGIIDPMAVDAVVEQSDAAIGALRRGLADAEILGLYLYGSAVAGGLRPDSDLDLFVVTDRRLTAAEKARIIEGLLLISNRETRPPTWRPIEVTIVAQPEVRLWRYPPRMELQYGEWLRPEFLSGAIEPEPVENPDLAVVITMVRQTGKPLIGLAATDVLDAVPRDDLVRAMVDTVPSLLSDLADDTRNVLLTLARIWTTIATGEIRSKDEAADWAVSRLPDAYRPTLAMARDLYIDGGYGDPWDDGASRPLAERLVDEITTAAR